MNILAGSTLNRAKLHSIDKEHLGLPLQTIMRSVDHHLLK